LNDHAFVAEAGSGQAASFHRPTSVELVVQPHYRIYTSGPHADRLAGLLTRLEVLGMGKILLSTYF